MTKRPASGFKPVRQILGGFDWDKNKTVSREFQLYGYTLAEELGDLTHTSMYIKFAKTLPRQLLEEARNFVKGASNARSRGRLFMWKLGELRKKSVVGSQ